MPTTDAQIINLNSQRCLRAGCWLAYIKSISSPGGSMPGHGSLAATSSEAR